jgi:hypothetical protein
MSKKSQKMSHSKFPKWSLVLDVVMVYYFVKEGGCVRWFQERIGLKTEREKEDEDMRERRKEFHSRKKKKNQKLKSKKKIIYIFFNDIRNY